YISSTSHSLAPKSEDGADEAESDGLVCCCDTSVFRLFRDVRVDDRGSSSRLVPHAHKYRSTVLRWCKVYPITTTGRCQEVPEPIRDTETAPPRTDRKGPEACLPPTRVRPDPAPPRGRPPWRRSSYWRSPPAG